MGTLASSRYVVAAITVWASLNLRCLFSWRYITMSVMMQTIAKIIDTPIENLISYPLLLIFCCRQFVDQWVGIHHEHQSVHIVPIFLVYRKIHLLLHFVELTVDI